MRFKGKAVGQAKSTVVMALAGIVAACGGGGSGGSSTPENIALAGTIDIEAGTRVDSDSADVLWLNDTPLDSPQRLPPEFLLAGYVSQAGGNYPALSGLPATEYFADPFDEFSMSLQSGQTVYLQAFGTRAGSSQLELALLDGSTVLASDTTATTGQIRVAVPDTSADGTYQIKVSAIGGTPMLYVMSTSASGTTSGLSFSWPDYPFREGEAIVALADTGPGASAAALDGLSVADSRRELAPGLWHLRMNRSFAREHASENATLQWIEQLRSSPGVVSVTPNYEMKALSPVSEPLYNDPTLGQQWHYSLINAPTAWQVVGDGGIGQRVAVMDTGLFASGSGWHSEIVGNLPSPLPGGLDFVDDDSIPQDPGDELGSSVYHGTHVAGTVAAAVNGSGGAGVAYESTLLPVRVLGEGGTGSSVDLLEALQWVGGPSGGERRADIVNLSLGGLPEISSMQSAINTATGKGVIFVAAAGNSATSEKSYPAAFDNVFSVSAVDGAGRLAS
ncbi:MAG: peptidase S8, partial [Gammaproteobacteria bacterium]